MAFKVDEAGIHHTHPTRQTPPPRGSGGRLGKVGPVADLAARASNGWGGLENPDKRPPGLAAWGRLAEPRGEWVKRVVVSYPGLNGADPTAFASGESIVVGAAENADTNR